MNIPKKQKEAVPWLDTVKAKGKKLDPLFGLLLTADPELEMVMSSIYGEYKGKFSKWSKKANHEDKVVFVEGVNRLIEELSSCKNDSAIKKRLKDTFDIEAPALEILIEELSLLSNSMGEFGIATIDSFKHKTCKKKAWTQWRYVEDKYFLEYRVAHGDRFFKSLIEAANQIVIEPNSTKGQLLQELKELNSKKDMILKKCTSCHLGDIQSDEDWSTSLQLEHGFKHPSALSHSSFDMSSEGDNACLSCHELEKEGEKLTKDMKYPGLWPVEKESCTSCHTPEKMENHCSTCHEYHQD